jgi:hypothetical protein
MAKLPEAFDPNTVAPDERNFEPIPAGPYNLQVIDSAIADTSTGSGQMLTLTLEVIDGPFEKRKLWDRLNIRNQNPDAQRIAQQALRNLCLALGMQGPLTDSEALHFKPFRARVTIEQDKSGQYGPQNRVRYLDPTAANGRPPVGKAAPQAAARAAASGSTTSPSAKPWAQPQKKDMNDDVPF